VHGTGAEIISTYIPMQFNFNGTTTIPKDFSCNKFTNKIINVTMHMFLFSAKVMAFIRNK
jgi:hypothetical protein